MPSGPLKQQALQDKNSSNIDFKFGDDNDIAIIWSNDEIDAENKTPASDKKPISCEKQESKQKVKEQETTEQVLDAVFYKETMKQIEEKGELDTIDEYDGVSDEKPKKISCDKKTTQSDEAKHGKYTEEKLTKMTCLKLRQIAIEYNIKLMTTQNGKSKQKTKHELIEEILTNHQ